MREAIRRLDAVVLLLRLLPMFWPLTFLVLLDFLMVGVVVLGCLAFGIVRLVLGAAAGFTFVLPVLVTWARGLLSYCTGGATTSMIVGIGVFLLVFRWWTRGAARRTSGLIGLCEVDVDVSTL